MSDVLMVIPSNWWVKLVVIIKRELLVLQILCRLDEKGLSLL